MQAGFAWDNFTDFDRVWASDDWGRFALELPMAQAPGKAIMAT